MSAQLFGSNFDTKAIKGWCRIPKAKEETWCLINNKYVEEKESEN